MHRYYMLVPGKQYPETGIRKIYAKISVRITNSPPGFLDTCRLGHICTYSKAKARDEHSQVEQHSEQLGMT